MVKSCVLCWFLPLLESPSVRSSGAEPTAHSCGPPHERRQLPGDYRAPGAPGSRQEHPCRRSFISPLPHSSFHVCLSGHALFFSTAFALFALGLFSLPSPHSFPVHLAVLAASAPLPCPPPRPCTFIPQLQPPAPTSPALAARSCASSAPCDLHLHLHPQTLSPYHGGKHGSGTIGVPAGVLHPYQKSFSPFSHLSLHVCPTLSHHLAPSICFMKGGHWGF